MFPHTIKLAAAISLLALGCAAPLPAGQRPEPPGWFTGDPHVHRAILCANSNAGRMLTPEEVLKMMEANDLDVVSVLADMGNGEAREQSEDLKLINGQDHAVSAGGRIVHWDAEWHFDPEGVTFDQKAIGGHLIVLGLRHGERMFREYTHPILEWARAQGAVAGFAHMQYLPEDGFPEKMTCCDPVEYPVEVALGSGVFLMEDVRGSETAIPGWYRLLNCGFRPGLAAGTDYPCDAKPAPLGNLLTYVHIPDGKLTYRKWIDGIAAGRTVVSRNGHREFLDLKVNGASGPGDEVALAVPGAVQVEAAWTSREPAGGAVEVVQDGKVAAVLNCRAAPGKPARLTALLQFTQSGWLAARRMDASGHVLHTGAVFVTVAGRAVRPKPEDAAFFVSYLDRVLEKTSPGGAWARFFSGERAAAQARYRAARAVYERLAAEAGSAGR